MWQFPCILASALFLGGSCHSWAMDAHLSSPHRSVSPGVKAQAEMETFCILPSLSCAGAPVQRQPLSMLSAPADSSLKIYCSQDAAVTGTGIRKEVGASEDRPPLLLRKGWASGEPSGWEPFLGLRFEETMQEQAVCHLHPPHKCSQPCRATSLVLPFHLKRKSLNSIVSPLSLHPTTAPPSDSHFLPPIRCQGLSCLLILMEAIYTAKLGLLLGFADMVIHACYPST